MTDTDERTSGPAPDGFVNDPNSTRPVPASPPYCFKCDYTAIGPSRVLLCPEHAEVTSLREQVKSATEILRPLSGLLAEHSDCYREGKCEDCRKLKADVAAYLEGKGE